ncbi:MAG: gliding motility-associated protein GldE [Bacteroidales bacterium]|nr:gliding motility-associated protein GldE [Bacteroidales bacterium]
MSTDPLPAIMGPTEIVSLVIACLALLLSGFISGSEIAYFSLTPAQEEDLDDSNAGRRVLALLRKPERLLATILIANNLVNVAIVVLTNFALGPVFTGMNAVLSFILQSVLLTFLILLFGEILPKLYANHNPMRWALFAAPALGFISTLFSPLSRLLVRSTSIVHRVVTKQAPSISTDELSQALEITDVQTDNADKQMLEGILQFGETSAAEIMTPRMEMTDIPYSADFKEVMRIVLDSGFSRIPVYEDSEDNIRGILYSRDLLPYIGKEGADFDWRTLLREAYYVPENRMIDDLLEDFRRRRQHLAIVVDEFGGTQGLVTMEDVLEEIVGDINDEYDEEETTYKRLADNSFVFEGRTLLTDFFRVTGLDEADYAPVAEDCETLAGMLLAIKGDFPKPKEPLVYARCHFLVMDVRDHRITRVRVKIVNADETGTEKAS